jgi:hypothetical protein
MNTSPNPSFSEFAQSPANERIRVGNYIALFGLFLFLVGAKPGWFGWDRSKVVGFVQIIVFLIGLATICIGGSVTMLARWRGKERSILADIGLRLVSTGYVICIFTGMADMFGMGSQISPVVPYFGPWQSAGVVVGEIVIAVGFLIMIPYQGEQQISEE